MVDFKELVLAPGIGVGEYRFGDEISPIADQAGFSANDDIVRHVDGSAYENDYAGLLILDDDGDDIGISTIHCEKHLFFEGQNLIGMHINALAEHLDVMPDFGSTDLMELATGERQFVFEFDTLGL